jgi:lysozyme
VIPAASVTAGSFIAGTALSSASGGAALTQVAKGQATVKFIAGSSDTSYTVTASGGGTMLLATPTTTAISPLNGTTAAGGFTWTPVTTVQGLDVLVTATDAGTTTVTFQPIGANGIPGTPVTATVTWVATPVVSANLSTAILNAAAGTAATSDTTATTVSSTLATQAFNIVVTVKDQLGNALNGQTLSATVTGSGLISAAAGNAGGVGAARAASVTLTGANVGAIGISADGTAGSGSVTILAGTTVLATKSFAFFGSVKTVTAAQNFSTAVAGGGTLGFGGATANATTQIPAVVLTLKDANGNVVPGKSASLSAKSSDTTVMSSTLTLAEDDGATVGAGEGTYNVQVNSATGSVSGKTATLTFRFAVGDGTFIESAPVTFGIGKSTVATVTMAFDKTSYAQGEAAVLTITAKDSSGNAVADGTKTGIFTAAPVYSKTVTGSLPTADITFVGGKATFKQFAPASSGAYTVNATVNPLVATAGASISAASSVVDGNAALLTQIDALNAKIVALNALIAKIMKKLGVK